MLSPSRQLPIVPRPAPFTYSRDGRVLICTLCPSAILGDLVKIRSHLYTQHGLPARERDELLRNFVPLHSYVSAEEDLHPLPDGSLIELALPVIKGFRCLCCDFRTAGKKNVIQHQATHLAVPRKAGRPSHASKPLNTYVPTLLQCWRPMFTANYPRRYWIVAPITRHDPSEIGRVREARPSRSGDGKWQIIQSNSFPDNLHSSWSDKIVDQAVTVYIIALFIRTAFR